MENATNRLYHRAKPGSAILAALRACAVPTVAAASWMSWKTWMSPFFRAREEPNPVSGLPH